MKNIPALLALSSALIGAQFAHADTLGIYAGGGVWHASSEGDIGTDATPLTLEELGFDEEQNLSFYVALEHPLPVLPNMRLAATTLELSGSETLARGSTDELRIAIDADFSIPDGSTVTSDIDLDFIDYTLYYELLDNYVSLDLGITARQFDGSASFSYVDASTIEQSTQRDLDVVLPMIYTKVQLDLPLTGWYFGGHANIIDYDDNSVADIEAKVGYMTEGLGLDLGFDLGFRQFSIETDPEDDDLTVDLTLDGPFASFFVHF